MDYKDPRNTRNNVSSLTGKARNKINRIMRTIFSLFRYRLRQVLYALNSSSNVPVVGYKILNSINHEGVAIFDLDDLGIPSTPFFLEAVDKALEDADAFSDSLSIEYNTGFDNFSPINPTYIARKYPAIYLWGLDEKLIDIIEHCMGLPIAYHGVTIRKDFVNSQQTGPRAWHKDCEDINTIRIMIYLNDVLDNNGGPFEYIPKSLSPSYKHFKWLSLQGEDEILDKHMKRVVNPSEWKTCIGPKNTAIVFSGAKFFHHGKVPLSERITATYCYTSREPQNKEICLINSFHKGLSLIKYPLTERQKMCIYNVLNE